VTQPLYGIFKKLAGPAADRGRRRRGSMPPARGSHERGRQAPSEYCGILRPVRQKSGQKPAGARRFLRGCGAAHGVDRAGRPPRPGRRTAEIPR